MTPEDQIDEIMCYFDFRRCAIAMDALDWKWQGEPVDEPALRQSALKYLREAKDA